MCLFAESGNSPCEQLGFQGLSFTSFNMEFPKGSAVLSIPLLLPFSSSLSPLSPPLSTSLYIWLSVFQNKVLESDTWIQSCSKNYSLHILVKWLYRQALSPSGKMGMVVGPQEAAVKIKLTNTWKGTSTVSNIILLADSFGCLCSFQTQCWCGQVPSVSIPSLTQGHTLAPLQV